MLKRQSRKHMRPRPFATKQHLRLGTHSGQDQTRAFPNVMICHHSGAVHNLHLKGFSLGVVEHCDHYRDRLNRPGGLSANRKLSRNGVLGDRESILPDQSRAHVSLFYCPPTEVLGLPSPIVGLLPTRSCRSATLLLQDALPLVPLAAVPAASAAW
jgi:hypothetical protein